jgi:biopolymer transport protein ExbB
MFLGDMNYFQILFWPGGGYIGMLLWMLSVVMVAIIITNALLIRRSTVIPDNIRQQVQQLFQAKQYREAIEFTSAEPSYFSFLVHAGLSNAPYGYAAMERALLEASEDRTSRLLRYAEWLNLLGNIGPMIGLLGTVWGLILTFFKIVDLGGVPDPGQLAGAIGIKLVCTLMGLVIAIPSLFTYGLMRNRLDTLAAEAIGSAQELIVQFRPGKKAAAIATAE